MLTFAAVVFRSELILLLGPLVLEAIVRQYTSIANVLRVGIIASTLSTSQSILLVAVFANLIVSHAALTMLVDSYFWQRWPLWPKLHGVYFNAIEGKSTKWGVRCTPANSLYTSLNSCLLYPGLTLPHVLQLTSSEVAAVCCASVCAWCSPRQTNSWTASPIHRVHSAHQRAWTQGIVFCHLLHACLQHHRSMWCKLAVHPQELYCDH